MSEIVFAPHKPPEDYAVLVRVEGADNIERVRGVVQRTGIPHVEGTVEENNVIFYVPRSERPELTRLVRASDLENGPDPFRGIIRGES